VVTGSVTARGSSLDEIRTLSLNMYIASAQRARADLSCRACRLGESAAAGVFIEQWADRAACWHISLGARFARFRSALQPLAAASTPIRHY